MMKQIAVGVVPIVIPHELDAKVRRLAAEYPMPPLPDLPRPRTVLDVGCGPGAFLAYAAQIFDWPWMIGVDAHPMMIAMAKENAPPGTLFLQQAISSTETGEASLLVRETERVSVPIMHPKLLPPAACLRVNIQGPEVEALREYRHWPAVGLLFVDWHTEHASHECAGMLREVGLRRISALQHRVDRATEVWARTRCQFDARQNRYTLPEAST